MTTRKRKYNPQEEAERLDSTIRMDGVGEDAVVREILSDRFVKAPDTDAAITAKALAELLTGQQMQNELFSKIMDRFEKIERAQRAWEKDKEKFLEEVDRRSASLIVTNPLEKEKMMAKWAETAKEAREIAVAENINNQLKFDEFLATQPMETIISPGQIEMRRVGETITPVVVGEVIGIKHRKWYLPPGKAVEVPKVVADRYREIVKSREVLEKRQAVMRDGKNSQSEIAKSWAQIDRDYKLGGDALPLAPE